MKHKLQEGNVYIAKLERGFYGAFKIIRKGRAKGWEDKESLMIAVLDFIDTKKPEITDERLDKILYVSYDYHYRKGNPYINLYSADSRYNNIKDYEFLGNRQLTETDRSFPFAVGMEAFSMAGSISDIDTNTMFYEWRWRNEKEQYIAEVEEARKKREEEAKKYKRNPQKPKKMMNDKLFWEIIDKIDWKQTDNDKQLELVIDFLSKQSKKTICEFEESLAYKLYLLDTMEHAKNISEDSYTGKEGDYFSVDNFLYVRCCVLANGKDYYEKVLKNPSEMPKDMEFEPLLYIAQEAYERKTGEEFEYSAGCDYETFSNREGWDNS